MSESQSRQEEEGCEVEEERGEQEAPEEEQSRVVWECVAAAKATFSKTITSSG